MKCDWTTGNCWMRFGPGQELSAMRDSRLPRLVTRHSYSWQTLIRWRLIDIHIIVPPFYVLLCRGSDWLSALEQVGRFKRFKIQAWNATNECLEQNDLVEAWESSLFVRITRRLEYMLFQDSYQLTPANSRYDNLDRMPLPTLFVISVSSAWESLVPKGQV